MGAHNPNLRGHGEAWESTTPTINKTRRGGRPYKLVVTVSRCNYFLLSARVISFCCEHVYGQKSPCCVILFRLLSRRVIFICWHVVYPKTIQIVTAKKITQLAIFTIWSHESKEATVVQ